MNQEEIGKFIAQQRKNKYLTQEQLAERLNVNNRSVSRWENGICMPDLSIIKELSKELDITVSELLNARRMSKEELMEMKEMIYCQSCHMPLQEESDKGKNADGTISEDYCKYCFENGEFINYKTVEEAIADSVNYAEYAGFTKEEMLEYAKKMYPTLKRWNN